MSDKKQDLIKKLGAAIDGWRPPANSEASVARTFAADRVELKKVMTLFRRGKWSDFLKAVWTMDTMPRELVPSGMIRLAESRVDSD